MPRPGVPQVYVYPGARDGRVIADVGRTDKGHTEELEPRVTEVLIKLMVEAPAAKSPGFRRGYEVRAGAADAFDAPRGTAAVPLP